MTKSHPGGDPVPAILEADATGEIAAIYTDIRSTTGVPVVNLIWRHLATMDGALPWTWGALRPLYASDKVAAAAAGLRADLDLPTLHPWPVTVLEAAGLSADDRTAISRILRSYDRSNAMNLVALAALQAHVSGATDASPLPDTPPGADIDGQLPLLLTFDAMAPATADVVYRLNAIGDPEHKVIASMYRHLAHWPSFLALVWERLSPLTHDGGVDAIIAANLTKGQSVASRLAAQIPDTGTAPNRETLQQVDDALNLFIRYAIGRMVPLGSLLARSFPHGE